ncbi:aminotransferase class V-fold PLP-dependent enzyme [Aureisphaera galaxeae]|uniref:aminotransferase class V-fold PLP-dependent enzyme n=1 Tax=Aureisphaera galaxeae TaxID=1538023 RepID=UPI00235074C9|nr:aminotransferase class V-fold PLP-dependent enzyme [Aureisphaera galaxeae]MDC8003343.1 aminotransferase class V-fold PLP-dependent enzyme [Aureisphaera galaxeae]
MNNLSTLFPVTQQHTYLNTASCGLFSKPLVDWRTQHDQKLMEGGSLFRDLHKHHIREIREGIARFFHTLPSQVALVPNFSFGMNVLLDGLPKGKKILLLKGDYPSVNWPIENRDFDVRYADIDVQLEDNIAAAVAKHRPDVLALSIVQYISGVKVDLNFLKELKSKYPDLLIIGDGTQFLGTTQFHFEESAFDIIGASAYKWLLSGYGCGLFLMKEALQGRLFPETIGYNSADADFSKRNAIEFVGHWEPGHQDTLNYGSMGESIRFLDSLGMDTVEDYLMGLNAKAKERFMEMGLLTDMASSREHLSTIFNLKGDMVLFEQLKSQNIIASLRGEGIRVSFHMYNTEDDLNKLVEVLKNR